MFTLLHALPPLSGLKAWVKNVSYIGSALRVNLITAFSSGKASLNCLRFKVINVMQE